MYHLSFVSFKICLCVQNNRLYRWNLPILLTSLKVVFIFTLAKISHGDFVIVNMEDDFMEIPYIWRTHAGLLFVDSVSTILTDTGNKTVIFAIQIWWPNID